MIPKDTSNRIPLALFLLRLSIFVVMAMCWSISSFVLITPLAFTNISIICVASASR